MSLEKKIEKISVTTDKRLESIKAKERAQKNQTGVLDDVAINLPALVRSLKLQKGPLELDLIGQIFCKFWRK